MDARSAESVPKDAEAVVDNLSTAVGGDNVLTRRETEPPTSGQTNAIRRLVSITVTIIGHV